MVSRVTGSSDGNGRQPRRNGSNHGNRGRDSIMRDLFGSSSSDEEEGNEGLRRPEGDDLEYVSNENNFQEDYEVGDGMDDDFDVGDDIDERELEDEEMEDNVEITDTIYLDHDGPDVEDDYLYDHEARVEGQLLAYDEAGVEGEELGDVHVVHDGPSVGVGGDEVEFSAEVVEAGPLPGMKFPTLGAIISLYKQHARKKGFCVVIRSTSKKGGPLVRYARLGCDRGGRRTECTKFTKKALCTARVNVLLGNDGLWKVNSVFDTHSHDLRPEMARLMAGHRHVCNSLKRTLQANDMAGLKVSSSIKVCEVQAGGPDKIGCSRQDCRNEIYKNRRLRLEEGDAESIKNFFTAMQLKDQNFFHLIDVDDYGRLKNVMWVHPHCRAAYEEFYDVISFDTTYLVNKYRMPFASFVGVNHHCQSILLGCALLCSETVETFKWLFNGWLNAMGGVEPTCMLTDQCESIKAAIREVFPTTTHRLCIWHIYMKLPTKLKGVDDYRKAKKEFKSLVQDSLTHEEFETRWEAFRRGHGLESNEWLLKLYSEKYNWAPVYLRHFFWAGMSSTQRSERMHAYFDGYVNSMSSLRTFVEKYEVALTDRHEKELEAELKSVNTESKLQSNMQWERQMERALTREVFKMVQQELVRLYQCKSEPKLDDHGNHLISNGAEYYYVTDKSIRNDFYGNRFIFTVEYRAVGQYINCNCKKFEIKGIICCHIMKIMCDKEVDVLNERYLLRRWRKDVYRPYLRNFLRGGYPTMSAEYQRYKELLKLFDDVVDSSMNDPAKMEHIKAKILVLKEEIKNWDNGNNDLISLLNQGSSEAEVISLGDPTMVKSRGRPKTNRLKSSIEVNAARGRGRNGGRGTRGGVGRGRSRGLSLTQ